MESEKVKEIKKCLVFCKDRLCEVCPRLKQEPNQEEDCRCALIEQSLTLINELESENETFLESKTMWKRLHTEVCKENQQLKDQIAELEKENENKTDTITDLLKKQEFYETEKLKQFAERLKEKAKDGMCTKGIFHIYGQFISSQDIDETLKEYTNENGKV